MSRTDKDRPYWVQLRDPGFKWPIRAHHNHWWPRGRDAQDCDLDFPLPVTRRGHRGCEWWPRYRDNDKLYGRSDWRRRHPGREGRARACLRKLRQDWIKTAAQDRGGIDSTRDAPTQRWVWMKWYWD
jgi:hypothetical protein